MMRHWAGGLWPCSVASWLAWTRSLAACVIGLAVVVAVAAYAFARILDMLERHASAVPPHSRPVVMSRVLADRSFKDVVRSEHFWRSLRSDRNRSRGRDDNMRWSPRPQERSDSYDDWRDEEPDPDDELTTYRTVCVRLCDGYYWPISFATSPERFARDAAVCEKSCSSSARLFVYRNPGEQLEQMTDLRGRRYTGLDTAFLYRSTYKEGCQCKPQPWAQESLDRHRMYALQAERRKGNPAAAEELKELRAKLATSDESSRARAQRQAEVRGSEPIMRLGGQDPPPAGDRQSRSSSARNDHWMKRVFEH
jgi:hypothetical protein